MSVEPTTTNGDLPENLQEILDDFAAVEESEKLQLLLEFANDLPELPQQYTEHPELLEPVPECQSPIFLITEIEPGEPAGKRIVRLHFSAPAEAPTTRGFAGILHEGLDGQTVDAVQTVLEADLGMRLSLADSVSPLRLRGLSGMLSRIQRQVHEKTQV